MAPKLRPMLIWCVDFNRSMWLLVKCFNSQYFYSICKKRKQRIKLFINQFSINRNGFFFLCEVSGYFIVRLIGSSFQDISNLIN